MRDKFGQEDAPITDVDPETKDEISSDNYLAWKLENLTDKHMPVPCVFDSGESGASQGFTWDQNRHSTTESADHSEQTTSMADLDTKQIAWIPDECHLMDGGVSTNSTDDESVITVDRKVQTRKTTPKSSRKFAILKREILARSRSQEWHVARTEWVFRYMYKKRAGTCVCTHHPISVHCVISNKKTGQGLVIGNRCVKNFDRKIWSIVEAVKRMYKCSTARPSVKLIKYAAADGVINDWERNFLLDILQKLKRYKVRKKKLTCQQTNTMTSIINQIKEAYRGKR